MKSKKRRILIRRVSRLVLGAIFVLSVVAVPNNLAIGQVRVTGTTARLTTDPAAQFDPSISGNIVVYTDLRNINSDIYYYDLSTNTETRVTSGSADERLNDVSGNLIVYTDYGATTGGGDIMSFVIGGTFGAVAADTTSPQQNPGIGGSVVAWEDWRDGNAEIYAKDLSSGTQKRLTNTSAANERDPAVSAGKVAYANVDGTACQVFVTDFATAATTQVTTAAGCHLYPDISGNTVVYQGNRDGNQDIFVYDLAAGRETRIVLAGLQRNPNVSGDWVAFEDVSTGNSDIKLYHVPTGSLFTVVATLSNEFLNDIDGNRIAYTGDAGGNLDIYVHTFTATFPPAAEQLGVSLPTPLSPYGLITATITQGGAPNFADTYVTPYVATQAGTISSWKAQFSGGNLVTGPGVPAGIQLKVLRVVGANTLQVISAGPVHDPRPTLQARFGAGYPFFQTEDSAIEFSDPGLMVRPGDIIGLTIKSDPAVGGYFYPLVSQTGTRIVLRDVPVGGTIDLNDPFTGTLPQAPALQVNVAPDDTTPPTISFSGPTTVVLRSSSTVTVTVTDAESGVAYQSAPNGPNALDTSTVGTKTFTVTARDNAGNEASNTWTYRVIYDFLGTGGFQSPISNPPTVNTANAGATVPVKWQLPDGMGGYISDLSVVVSITFQQVQPSDFSTALSSEISTTTSGSSGLRYDSTTNQFIYNWKTDASMAGKCYVLILKLNDGSEYRANFRLR